MGGPSLRYSPIDLPTAAAIASHRRFLAWLLGMATLALAGCGILDDTPLFERVETQISGLTFRNAIPESDSLNIVRYEYIYNGGGVAVEDFDGNGLPDLFFTGNTVSSRLYLQREPWRFEDVTEAAGLTTDVWCAGVSLADADGDGQTDIYLATLDLTGARTTPNLLFLRAGTSPGGTPLFREAAAELGLADRSYSTHAAWFDADRDGDLDVYLLNNAIEDEDRNTPRGTDTSGRGASVDVFYRNDGPGASPRFSKTAYAKTEGWGLGVAAQDFNRDGYPDLYVANDFLSDDLLLVNRGGGGFGDSLEGALPHTSYNAMGVDVADLDGDANPEIVTVDMLPDDNLRLKTMFADVPHQADAVTERRGYGKQYVRNVLQRNNGDGTFSDVGLQAGIAATDWSWAPLLADLDNDGDRDLYVTNGYPKDITDRDFVDYTAAKTQFGTPGAQLTAVMEALAQVDGVHQADFFFRNEGELRFADVSGDWGDGRPTYANGAAFADLDGDGDLDLVTNNINEPAGLYRNRTRERDPATTHYLQVELIGPPGNPDALGTKLYLRADSLRAYHEHYRQRGYLSTVSDVVHFGTGATATVDSLLVVWPDGRVTQLDGVSADQRLTLRHADADSTMQPKLPPWTQPTPPTLVAAGAPVSTHQESPYSDFDHLHLALRDNSRDGPALAAFDIDGDGRDELIVGGGAGQADTVFARIGASWRAQYALPASAPSETTAFVPLDLDGDGDLDLFAGRGSSEFAGRETLLRDVVYVNRDGRLVPDGDVLPADLPSFPVGAAAAGDVDGDGDVDLFVGARLAAGRYPEAPASLLLINEGGRFALAQELALGMVTGAVMGDLDGDGRADLAAVGEYAPLQVYHAQPDGRLAPTSETYPATPGWWYSLTAADLDGDGDLDLLAGNAGLNAPLRATPERPVRVRVEDVDDNGALDPIVTAYVGEEAVPVHPRNTLARQLPRLKQQMPSYRAYAGWTADRLPPVSDRGFVHEARTMASQVFINAGDGSFVAEALPPRGQDAPVRDAVEIALADGRTGLLVVQNDHAVEPLGGRLDAGTGFLLTVNEQGAPVVDPDYWSVRGDARSVARVDSGFVVGINDGDVRIYHAKEPRH